MKTDPIKTFILKDRNNLRIAANTSDVWLATRHELVVKFQESLKNRLSRKLKGWVFGPADGFFFETVYAGFYFENPTWGGQYSLGLQLRNAGEQAVFGACRNKNELVKRPFSDELYNAVVGAYYTVDQDSWWEVRVKMQSPAADWRHPKVLWRMHKDKKFLEEVAEQLLEFAEIAVPIVDGLVHKYKK